MATEKGWSVKALGMRGLGLTGLRFVALLGLVSLGVLAAANVPEPARVSATASPENEPPKTLQNTETLPVQRLARRLVISIADRKIALFEGNELRRMWDVAVGKKSTPSPVGTFTIANRVVNPTWYGAKEPVGPGPKNPVGTRWMGLSKKGFGIHGTNAPKSIGTAASHGCIRMHKDDVEELFELISEGDEVELVEKPTGRLVAAFSPAAAPQATRPSPKGLAATGAHANTETPATTVVSLAAIAAATR